MRLLTANPIARRLPYVPVFHWREVKTLAKCATALAVLTYGEPSIIEAVAAWIGRL